MKINSKAFTLIELLAVIVILAIIALIATPIVLNIIKDTKESSQLQSAEFYLGAVENAVASSTLNNKKLENKTYKILKDGNICIEYKENECINKLNVEVSGEIPISGIITLQNGKIEEVKLKYENEKIIAYDKNKKLVYALPEPYQESENIEIPDLYNNTLTPVIYVGDNWRVADVTEKWYDYSNQEWANAVILNSSVKKKIGDAVTVEGENPDALAMFVWIPRYEYKIEGIYGKGGTSKASPGEIEVNFINKKIKEATTDYRIHPAFNFGGEDISGIWVGKFELSHATKTGNLGCTTETCSESDKLRVLPNMQALRNNKVSSLFYAVRSMGKDNNEFNIDSKIVDIHMIKNSEWGVSAYLSQSKYGKYGNGNYEASNKEIYINNSIDLYTGRSGGSYGGNTAVNLVYLDKANIIDEYINTGYYTYDGYLLEYNTNNKTETRDLNKVASTTGNIYGIYDMTGGAWEYVMGVFANSDGEKWAGTNSNANSGFSGKLGSTGTDIEGLVWPDEKYYDVYKASNGTSISSTTACNGSICYGHALSEIEGWYRDYASFVTSNNPWLVRGGRYSGSDDGGIFVLVSYYGNAVGHGSTRVILTSST